MKRFLYLGFLLFSVGLLFLLTFRGQDPYHYTYFLRNGAELAEIRGNRKQTDRDLINRLTFNQCPLFFDELSSAWFYSVDPNEPDIDPSVGFSAGENDLRIAFSEKIVPGRSIPFTAYTGSEYKDYLLTVTTLPLIEIDSEVTDYPTGIDIQQSYPMHFTLFDNRPEALYPYVRSEGTIHIRGDISRFFLKKNFRIQLTEQGVGKEVKENQIPLLGLRKDGDWVLYSAYNDQEKIRNVFTSNLWMESCADDNSFGLKNGMEYRFAELFWNHRYCGLYAMGYPIDAKQMNIQHDTMGHYEEFLFKQKHWGPKTIGPDPNYDGVILQFDASQSDLNNGIAIMKMYFEMLENGAANGLWNNDEKNLLDLWLFVKLIQAADTVRTDGRIRNVFFTIKRSDFETKILYTPWDLDISWGNITNTYNPAVINYTIPYILDAEDNSYELTVNPITVLRKNSPEITAKIKNRWKELRREGWSETAIDRLLDGFEQDIFGSGAYLREMVRWPEGSYQDPEPGLSVFREYVHTRLRSMDSYIEAL